VSGRNGGRSTAGEVDGEIRLADFALFFDGRKHGYELAQVLLLALLVLPEGLTTFATFVAIRRQT
jgi:hypothetical protein